MEKNILNYDPQEYNLALADALKSVSEFEVPEWSRFVKSGVSKERPIEDKDFWFKRAASILRQIYKSKNKVVGVQRCRTRYGSKKDRGMRPEQFRKSSGKIIRLILQQCDKAGFTEIFKGKKERSGRKLTDKGKEFLEGINIREIEKIKNSEANASKEMNKVNKKITVNSDDVKGVNNNVREKPIQEFKVEKVEEVIEDAD